MIGQVVTLVGESLRGKIHTELGRRLVSTRGRS